MSANFDNIADEQALSPTLLESYLNAAADISRMAVGDKTAPSIDHTYTNPTYMSQHPWDRVAGRAVRHARRHGREPRVSRPTANTSFEMTFNSGENTRFEDIDISIDGERVALVEYELINIAGADGRGQTPLRTEPILVKAGQHKVAAAFVRKIDGPYEDLIKPHDWSYAGGGSGGSGITTLPHMGDLVIRGPIKTTGISTTPSRQKIFTCRPTSTADERVVRAADHRAPRRRSLSPAADRRGSRSADAVLRSGRREGRLRDGRALGASKRCSPARTSSSASRRRRPTRAPAAPIASPTSTSASRLSFFLWGLPPDQELIDAAGRRELSTLAGLEKHARRMLADPRADALAERFAAQWLRLQDIDKVHPIRTSIRTSTRTSPTRCAPRPSCSSTASCSDDRSVLDLLTADYTFLNERLARHYGIPGVVGSEFRRVTYPDATAPRHPRPGHDAGADLARQPHLAGAARQVGDGSAARHAAAAAAARRADLEAAGEAKDGRLLTTRERMEIHRKNATCNSCHRFMDPIGLALDNFDVTAQWRAARERHAARHRRRFLRRHAR